MAERPLRVLNGKKPADDGSCEPSSAHSAPAHVLPHPLLPLQPPAWLRGRILTTLRALEEKPQAPRPVLELVVPPAALKHRILERLTTRADVSSPIHAPIRSAVHRREPRSGNTRTAGHPFPKKERAQSPLRRRPRWSFSVDEALSFTRAFAGGAALILTVFLGISTVRLVRTQERIAATHRATQESLQRMALFRSATAKTQQQLAESRARLRQQPHHPEDATLTELRNACVRLLRSNELLRRALQETELEQQRAKTRKEHTVQQAAVASREHQEALRSVEWLEQELALKEAQSSELQAMASPMVVNLK